MYLVSVYFLIRVGLVFCPPTLLNLNINKSNYYFFNLLAVPARESRNCGSNPCRGNRFFSSPKLADPV